MFFPFTNDPNGMTGFMPFEAPTTPLFVSESDSTFRPAQSVEILQAAECELANRIRPGADMRDTDVVFEYLRVRMGTLPYELFAVLLLDNHCKLIRYEEMFRGTLTCVSVHPREIAKQVLAHNAAAVILVHNHPSGNADVSHADEFLTEAISRALALFEVRVHDHLIVTADGYTSMAKKGLV